MNKNSFIKPFVPKYYDSFCTAEAINIFFDNKIVHWWCAHPLGIPPFFPVIIVNEIETKSKFKSKKSTELSKARLINTSN